MEKSKKNCEKIDIVFSYQYLVFRLSNGLEKSSQTICNQIRKEIEKLMLLPLSTAAKDIATRESGYICESLIFFSVIVRNYYDRLRSFKIVSLFFQERQCVQINQNFKVLALLLVNIQILIEFYLLTFQEKDTFNFGSLDRKKS